MKARFFLAKACFNTWKKLFVLTESGFLYSEYLVFMRPANVGLEYNFETFTTSDFSWGGYQPIEEISKEQALKERLTFQSNWIAKYLDSITELERSNEINLNKFRYKNLLEKVDKLQLVIVGQDPYPKGANGIAFCKNTFDELLDQYCCGKDVLVSLGINIQSASKEFKSPVEFFEYLLVEKGIAFINVNHKLFSENKDSSEEFIPYNEAFLSKAENIAILGETLSKDVFFKYYPHYKEAKCFIHPSGKARNNFPLKWEAVWGTNFLQKTYFPNQN